MKRHYRSNPRPAGRVIRGVAERRPAKLEMPLVPVSEGLVECPTCQGGVKLVGSSFSDPELGIVAMKTKVYGSHVYGGARSSGHDNRCPSSHTKVGL